MLQSAIAPMLQPAPIAPMLLPVPIGSDAPRDTIAPTLQRGSVALDAPASIIIIPPLRCGDDDSAEITSYYRSLI